MLRCRVADAGDLPSLRALWVEESGWGALGAAAWEELIVTGPYGPPVVVVCEDGDGIAGQLILHRSRVHCDGDVLDGFRPFAPIVAGRWKRTSAGALTGDDHPLPTMARFALDELLGDAVVHWLPDPRFARFLRRYPVLHLLHFPHWSRPLDEPVPASSGVSWRRLEPDELPALSLPAVPEPCSLVRDLTIVRWKARVAGQHLMAVERDGDLVAVVAGRYHGDRQWQIEDVLGSDTSARRAAIAAAVEGGVAWRGEHAGPRGAIKAGILATPGLQPVLGDLGFTPDAYTFLFAVGAGPATARASLFDPASWYVSAMD